jgi:hypothetical protein
MITNRDIKEELVSKRLHSFATLKDIKIIMEAAEGEDFTQARKTKLYINHSGEYCQLLEILNSQNDKKLYCSH